MINCVLLVVGISLSIVGLLLRRHLKGLFGDLDGFEGVADEHDLETGEVRSATQIRVGDPGSDADEVMPGEGRGTVGRFGDEGPHPGESR